MRYVLDSWVLMAWIKGQEPACRHARRLLERAAEGQVVLWINMINVGEVYYLLLKHGQRDRAEEFLDDIDSVLPVKTLVPDRQSILAAARLKGLYPISYADAFAAATAMTLKVPLVTGDPELRTVPGLKIKWIGAAA